MSWYNSCAIFLEFILIFTNVMIDSRENCIISTVDNLLTADCVNKGINEVPQDLDTNIQALKLSNNTIEYITARQFDRYQYLKTLIINYVNGGLIKDTEKGDIVKPVKANRSTFNFFDNLVLLDISNSFFGPDPKFEFARYIEKLYIENTFYEYLDVALLENLRELKAAKNILKLVPRFHQTTPLVYLDLKGNPLESIDSENVAHLCALTYLGFDLPNDWAFETVDFCGCLSLKAWLEKHPVQGLSRPLNCRNTSLTEILACDEPAITKTMKRGYANCVNRLYDKKMWIRYLIVFLIFILIIVVVFLAVVIIKCMRNRSKKK